ncbi:hypothetical protein NC652_010007 [Populus alba x Populus x berolinensis]|nr:hypothetical protein NC652_010007 [Populus alba x Populus x berolinensis]
MVVIFSSLTLFLLFVTLPLIFFKNPQTTKNNQCPLENSNSVGSFSPSILSSSPPSHQLENLSLYQTNHLQALANGENLASGYSNFPGLDALEVKNEECQLSFKSTYNQHSFMPHSYSSVENAAKMMQRSYSSNSFEGKPGFLLILIEQRMQQRRSLSSPLATESSFIEESNFKVGRYSAEERKERISKYRAKRTQRNFTKTIKVRQSLFS